MGMIKQVTLYSHPAGVPRVDDFEIKIVEMPQLSAKGVMLKTLWLSLDPLIHFSIEEKLVTGRAHVRVGDVVYGSAVSRVVASDHAGFCAGEYVEGRTGWQEYAAIDPVTVPLRKIDSAAAPLSTALGVLGLPGQTAHCCIIEIGRVRAGETVVISAAAGAVGTLAGQIGKILGARVIGIAGGAQKCEALVAMGFDAAVDYKAPDFAKRLATVCPGGIDVYVENVGGEIMRTVMPMLKYGGRMPLCGFIAEYPSGLEGIGPDRLPWLMRMIMSKGMEIRGFSGSLLRSDAMIAELTGWVQSGQLRYPETVVEGLENAPEAFSKMFRDNVNIGKLLVRVAQD